MQLGRLCHLGEWAGVLEDRADGFVVANFFADSMQSERCLKDPAC